MDKELEEICVYLEGLDNEVDAAYVRNLFKDLYIDIERLQEEIRELQVYHTGSLVCKERHAAQRCTEIIQSVTKLKHRDDMWDEGWYAAGRVATSEIRKEFGLEVRRGDLNE